MLEKPELPACNFCGKSEQTQVGPMIGAADGTHICMHCLEINSAMLMEDPMIGPYIADTFIQMVHGMQKPTYEEFCSKYPVRKHDDKIAGLSIGKVHTPMEMRKALDAYVIGQDLAKKTLCVAVYNHYMRLLQKNVEHAQGMEDVQIEKSNILLAGPTGSGKTLLAKTLARILNVPFCIVDATTLTEAGYVGEDVENIVLRLLQAADGDIEKAEKGIIYVDEMDKIGRKTSNVSITRDVSGEGVQQALLKIIEGTECNIPPKGGRKHPNQEYIQVNTEQILFICGGAFVGLEEIIRKRLGSSAMGFASINEERDRKELSEEEVLGKAMPEDFFSFGMIPELVGRLPVFSPLTALSEAQLIELLTKPKNALVRQYSKLLGMSGVKLIVEKSALKAMAKMVIDHGTGARALRSIFERIMLDVMYKVPNEKNVESATLTEDVVLGKSPVILTYKV